MIRSLEERGLCYVASSLEDFGRLLLDCSEVKRVEFNEAKRVAEWIAERWSS
jgi:sigma54-dependent transcription regulator